MIRIENVAVFGWDAAIRGARNPMNSWDKSDSEWKYPCTSLGPGEEPHYCNNCGYDACSPLEAEGTFVIGPDDLNLLRRLSKAGSDHGKFLRMIHVQADVTAPLYWWKEYDTYKVGTVANSCSTMHKIHEKPFEMDDFSHEHLFGEKEIIARRPVSRDYYEALFEAKPFSVTSVSWLSLLVELLNFYRERYLETKNKDYWWQLIQLLPASYNQRRTLDLNYAVLKAIYASRKGHKLDEWGTFRAWIETLPYAPELIGKEDVPVERDTAD